MSIFTPCHSTHRSNVHHTAHALAREVMLRCPQWVDAYPGWHVAAITHRQLVWCQDAWCELMMWCNRGCFRLLGGPDRRPRVCIFRPSIFILMTWCVELVRAHVGDGERRTGQSKLVRRWCRGLCSLKGREWDVFIPVVRCCWLSGRLFLS